MLLYILVSVIIVSLLSFSGLVFISMSQKKLDRILFALIAFASGALLGDAFIHLIPESVESGLKSSFIYVILGMLLFFVLEKFIHWRHCHKGKCDVHPFAYLNLIGDGVHNFIDGLLIAASYLASVQIGIATTIAVIAHEIPQEIGDFGVLVYGGFTKAKALFYNFLSALTAVAGALVGYFSVTYINTAVLVPFAAGGFIYIALTDLIPELHKKTKISDSVEQLIFILIGIGLMWALKAVFA